VEVGRLEPPSRAISGRTQAERQQLIALLSRVGAEQGLPTGVHPGVVDTNAEDKT
jgi:hypothetical protein